MCAFVNQKTCHAPHPAPHNAGTAIPARILSSGQWNHNKEKTARHFAKEGLFASNRKYSVLLADALVGALMLNAEWAISMDVRFRAVYRSRRCIVKLLKFKVVLIGLLLALTIVVPVLAQTIRPDDDSTLKQILIFGRHSIRSGTNTQATLDQFSVDPYPPFTGVPVGYLTPNGQEAARLMGAYFNAYLTHEGLLTGNTSTDLPKLYFRANSIQRSNVTASFFGAGLIPGATVPVHSYTLGTPDPVFDPIKTKVATADPDRAQAEILGFFQNAAALTSAYRGELALVSSVLYPPGTQPINPPGTLPPLPPAPPGPQGSYDPTTIAFALTVNDPIKGTGGAFYLGGLSFTTTATDSFMMQYADGFDPSDVAWGRLTPDTLSQETRLTVLEIGIQMRLPYIDQVQSSNAANHILRSMNQVVSGSNSRGAFGTSKSRIVAVISSDYYVAGMAGLLGVHWTLPGYQQDYCSPGGMMVFELRHSRSMGNFVRVFYTSQTLEQLRSLTSLSLTEPPATMQLAIPGASISSTNLDVKWSTFKKLLTEAIDQKYVQPYGKEVPPGILNNVPLD